MFTIIINDCKDENVRGRQESRICSLLDTPVSFVGVHSDLEAGMNLVDMLDATEGRSGLILVNTAPRGGHTTKWENGTPFAYFWHKNTLVVSSVDGLVLAGVKKLLSLNEVSLLDTHTASSTLHKAGYISIDREGYMPITQFRSFDFTPYVGAYLFNGGELPSTPYPLDTIPSLPPAIWQIDNFGNCKTTLTPEEITDPFVTRFGTFPCIPQLRNVPDAITAVIIGSSGIGKIRLLELVIQRQSFAKHHSIQIGDDIFSEKRYFTTATDANTTIEIP